MGSKVDSKATKNKESSRAEKVNKRANRIKKMVEINTRWERGEYLLVEFILANKEIGTSQVLKIMRGAESLSIANLNESLCQRDEEWSLKILIAKKEIRRALTKETLR